jgi:sarcosine oxidase subunit alpha
MNAPTPVARTPLHHWHATRGARFVDRDGWQVVAGYAAADREAEAARAGVGLADVSATAKTSLRGPGVAAVVRALLPEGSVPGPHGVAAIPAGTSLACNLSPDHLLLLGPGPPAALVEAPAVVRTDVTSAYAGLWLMGPGCEDLLRRLTQLDVREDGFPVNSCAETGLAGVEALLVRTAELSLPSVRVYVPWDLAEYVWERVLLTGPDAGITPVGLEALGLLGARPA